MTIVRTHRRNGKEINIRKERNEQMLVGVRFRYDMSCYSYITTWLVDWLIRCCRINTIMAAYTIKAPCFTFNK